MRNVTGTEGSREFVRVKDGNAEVVTADTKDGEALEVPVPDIILTCSDEYLIWGFDAWNQGEKTSYNGVYLVRTSDGAMSYFPANILSMADLRTYDLSFQTDGSGNLYEVERKAHDVHWWDVSDRKFY